MVSNPNVWARFNGPNMGYLYDVYERYKENPEAIDPTLKALFDENGAPPTENQIFVDLSDRNENRNENCNQIQSGMKLFDQIRNFGHLAANINPLEARSNVDLSFLQLDKYNLTKEELHQISARMLWKDAPESIKTGWDAFEYLKKVYTHTVAFEFGHIHHQEERKWLDKKIENEGLQKGMSKEAKISLLERLQEVNSFEVFLHKTFVGQKRFSIEGVDILVPMLDCLIKKGIEDRTENIMMGMAHRGRLNVLAHVLGKPYEQIFSEFHSSPNKELVPSEGSRGINFGWSGDVKYHLGADRKIKSEKEHIIHLNLANNPSHLEFVDPVVQGITRAAQEDRTIPGFPKQDLESSFSVLIHGDAAFPGEGVVAETLNLSNLKGYKTGGTIHIIANNLIGFTTDRVDSRSTRYSSDLAKGYEIPIIHVNADDPENCIAVMELAYEYRKTFKKDILIDLVGYRRFGHNEMDDPEVTQPYLYQLIHKHPRLSEKYADELIQQSIISKEEVTKKTGERMEKFQSIFNSLTKKEENTKYQSPVLNEEFPDIKTTIPKESLQKINKHLLNWPESFHAYPKLERILRKRENLLESGEKIDWAFAETLAFATIISEGTPIRLTGQDSERGTFAHRHLVLHDYQTHERLIPLHNLKDAKASFTIYNSPLSETAVLGFEYGYSVQAPETQVIWEAQFGDFVNVAQVIIDQFISSGRTKWGQKSNLIMLLPHGYEGQGPEHSSARLERFLELAAENNWFVANVTSAAQYFHILRRHAKLLNTDEARPLIIMAPKSLLRHPHTASSLEEFTDGGFKPLMEQIGTGDHQELVERLILCSGKIAIDLASAKFNHLESLHIARVEQLYPFPKRELLSLIKRFPNLKEIIWVQEEPKNMGAWHYILANLIEFVPESLKIDFIGRPMRSSPSTGDPHIHKLEQNWIVETALNIGKGGEYDG